MIYSRIKTFLRRIILFKIHFYIIKHRILFYLLNYGESNKSFCTSYVRRNTHIHTPLKNIPPKYPNHQHNKPTTMKKHIANTR